MQIQSLRILCLAQNKIEALPLPTTSSKRSKEYNCPCLEEVQLQDNRLEYLHPAFFSSLRSLTCLDISNNKLQSLPFEMWSAPKLKELNVAFNMLSELPMHEELQDMSSDHDNDSVTSDNLSETNIDLDSSDNTSLDDSTRSIQSRNTLNRCDLRHHSLWSTNVEIRDKTYFVEALVDYSPQDGGKPRHDKLQILNLAHNAFSVVPRSLSCLAPHLTRLNMSYNKLTKMGHLAAFPMSLKHLDLSHNQIDAWPLEAGADNICYADILPNAEGRKLSNTSATR